MKLQPMNNGVHYVGGKKKYIYIVKKREEERKVDFQDRYTSLFASLDIYIVIRKRSIIPLLFFSEFLSKLSKFNTTKGCGCPSG